MIKKYIDWLNLGFFFFQCYWKEKTAPNWHQYYRSPGWKTAYLHWRPSCRCQPGSAGWTSWSGAGVSAAACTSPCPSGLPSADQCQSGCRWLALREAHIGERPSGKSFGSENREGHSPSTEDVVIALADMMNRRMRDFNVGAGENTRFFVKVYSSFKMKKKAKYYCCRPQLCITDLPFSAKLLQR